MISDIWRDMAEGMAFGRKWREQNVAEQKRNRLAELAQGVFQNDPRATAEAYSLDPNTAKAYTTGADRQALMLRNGAKQIKQAPTPDLRARIYQSLLPQLQAMGGQFPRQWDESLMPQVDTVLAQTAFLDEDKPETWSNAGNGLMTSNRGNAKNIPGYEPKGPSLRPVQVPQSDGSTVLMNYNPTTGEFSMPNFGGEQPQPIGIDDPAIQADIASLPPDQQEAMRQLLQAGESGQEVSFRVDGGQMIPGRTDQATGRPIVGVRPPKPGKGPNERQAPAGYRWTANGGLEFIPGGPADPARKPAGASGKGGGKAPTEDAAKAAGWYDQALNAFKNMEKARLADENAEYPSGLESFNSIADYLVPDGLVNYTRSPNRQKYLQGSSALTEAVLRAATGAAITKEEALQKARELIPQPGDSKEVVEQKRKSLTVYLNALKRRGAPALGAQTSQAPTGDLSGLSDDELKRQLGL